MSKKRLRIFLKNFYASLFSLETYEDFLVWIIRPVYTLLKNVFASRKIERKKLFMGIAVLLLVVSSWTVEKYYKNKKNEINYSISQNYLSGAYTYENKNKEFTVSFLEKEDESKPWVNFESGENSLKMALEDGISDLSLAGKKELSTKVQSVKEENQKKDKLTIEEVLPQTDITYEVIDHGIKEDIVLKDKKAVENKLAQDKKQNKGKANQKDQGEELLYKFTIESDKVEPIKRLEGSYGTEFQSKETKEYAFHFLKPVMIDAKGQRSEEVMIEVKDAPDKKYEVIIKPSLKWLQESERAYPIRIDPSIVHDTQGEFDAGTALNWVESVAGPKVQLKENEATVDANTVALWHMNETANGTCTGGKDVCDVSGNSNNGTATGTTIVDGKFGKARSFNGSSDYIDIKDSALMSNRTDLTMEAWIKKDNNVAKSMLIYSENQSGGEIFGFYIDSNNKVGFQTMIATSNWQTLVGNTAITLGTWHHVAATLSSSGMKVYLDGNLDGSLNNTSVSVGSVIKSTIGRLTNTGVDCFFNGSIDEIKFSNVARSAEQIKVDAQKRPYGNYTSSVIDLGETAKVGSFQWQENGVRTGDGETPYSTTGLVAQWNFNETSGTTAVSSAGSCGSACNGTLTNMTTSGQDAAVSSGWTANNKKWGAGAVMFDGSDDIVVVPDNNNLSFTTNLSAEAWFKTSSSNSMPIFTKETGGSLWPEYSLSLNNGVITAAINSGNLDNIKRASYSTTYNDGKWHLAAMTYQGDTLKLYVDGRLAASTATNITLWNSTSPLGIGRDPGSNSSRFIGVIDSVRIYSRALSADEILSNYQAGNIEFQTRSGSDATPEDGGWEDWKPAGSGTETQIDSMDSFAEEWDTDAELYSNSLTKQVSQVDTGSGKDGAISLDPATDTTYSLNNTTNWSGQLNGRSDAYAMKFLRNNAADETYYGRAGDDKIVIDGTSAAGLIANASCTVDNSSSSSDEVLIINLQGSAGNYSAVGQYETQRLKVIQTGQPSGKTTLTFCGALTNSYDGSTQKIMVQRVPQFVDVTIGGASAGSPTLTADAWSGGDSVSNLGGVLFFRATGTVTVNSDGKVDMTGRGFRGGSYRYQNSGTFVSGYQGESYVAGSLDVISTSNAYGTGGGGQSGAAGLGNGAGGGGGGYGSTGTTGLGGGTNGAPGLGGNAYGITDNSKIFLGSGGGTGGHHDTTGSTGPAGFGGGIVSISASAVSATGSIWSKGSNAADSTGNCCKGGSGGGSGGSVYVTGNNINTGTAINISGGNYSNGTNSYHGGSGSAGMAYVEYVSSLSGTPTPVIKPAYSIQLQDENNAKQEGTGSLSIPFGIKSDDRTIGLWHMDETGGTGAYIKDYSGNGNNGTPTGTSVADGIYGKARSFNGSSDVIDTSLAISPAQYSELTLEAWIKPTGTKSSYQPIFSGDDGGYDRGFGINPSATTLGIQVGNATWTPGVTVDIGSWQHVAVVYSSTQISFYKNGIRYDYGSGGSFGTSNQPLQLGYDVGCGSTCRYAGVIDEVKVSNVVKTDNEVAESYRMGRDHRISKSITSTDLSTASKLPFYVAADKPGKVLDATIGESAFANYESDANTVGLWHLEEQSGSGAYVKDSSSYANNGTPTGTTLVDGKVGKGRSFNGSSDYVNILNLATPNKITLSAWTYIKGMTNVDSYYWSPIINKDNYPSNQRSFEFSYGSTDPNSSIHLDVSISTNGSSFTTVSVPVGNAVSLYNKWHYVVGSYDGNILKLYMDGVLVGSTSISGTLYNSSAYTQIGTRCYGYQNWVNGIIDEVRIDSIARTPTEIRQAYEIGKRTHSVTVDFAASLDSGNLISGSSDKSFTINSQTYGAMNKGDNLYVGEKVIVKENYDGTEYLAQGTVTSVDISSGAVSVAAWDSGSTFPSVGYSVNATVFKWQREYFDIGDIPADQKDAINRITFRLTDGTVGRNIYLDDLKSVSSYLTNPSATSNVISGANRYFQYKAILSTSDTAVTPYLSSVTLKYMGIPTNVSATDGTFTDKVRVSWTKVANATGYRVYRDGVQIGGNLGDVDTYDDTDTTITELNTVTAIATDGTVQDQVGLSLDNTGVDNTHTYTVEAFDAETTSAQSEPDMGYWDISSNVSYQWQRSAADSDANYSNIPGATTVVYNDSGAPADGSGRYYRCLVDYTGLDSVTSTVDRGYIGKNITQTRIGPQVRIGNDSRMK